eukprot:363560-Chlamydomonas_euryale.AAC.12
MKAALELAAAAAARAATAATPTQPPTTASSRPRARCGRVALAIAPSLSQSCSSPVVAASMLRAPTTRVGVSGGRSGGTCGRSAAALSERCRRQATQGRYAWRDGRLIPCPSCSPNCLLPGMKADLALELAACCKPPGHASLELAACSKPSGHASLGCQNRPPPTRNMY